jgi:hypothetical protein
VRCTTRRRPSQHAFFGLLTFKISFLDGLLEQKVPVNGIHLQINISASSWVRNKKEPPHGAQPHLTCTSRWPFLLTLTLHVVSSDNDLTQVWKAHQPLRQGEP